MQKRWLFREGWIFGLRYDRRV